MLVLATILMGGAVISVFGFVLFFLRTRVVVLNLSGVRTVGPILVGLLDGSKRRGTRQRRRI